MSIFDEFHAAIERTYFHKDLSPANIDYLKSLYLALPRPDSLHDNLLHKAKFAFMGLRYHLAEYANYCCKGIAENRNAIIERMRFLQKLDVKLSQESIDLIIKYFGNHHDKELEHELIKLLALQGQHDAIRYVAKGRDRSEAIKIAGPSKTMHMVANFSCGEPFSRWSKRIAYKSYFYEGSGVYYRGIYFKPGDIVLSNVNLDGNGVYTAMGTPHNLFYHAAIFGMVNGVPAVAESYEKGVRLVPLSEFLTPLFSSYIEVIRLNSYEEGEAQFATKINNAMSTIEQDVVGYNFDTEDEDRRYLACTRIPSFVYEKAGYKPFEARSTFSGRMRENLSAFGFTYGKYLAPLDLLTDPQFHVIGVIDNNHYAKSITRELCERGMRRMFEHRIVSQAKFPLSFKIDAFFASKIQRGTPLGHAIGIFLSHSPKNIPKGNPLTLAAVGKLCQMMSQIVRTSSEDLIEKRVTEMHPFRFQDFFEDETIKIFIDDKLSPFRKWFPTVDLEGK